MLLAVVRFDFDSLLGPARRRWFNYLNQRSPKRIQWRFETCAGMSSLGMLSEAFSLVDFDPPRGALPQNVGHFFEKSLRKATLSDTPSAGRSLVRLCPDST